MFRYLALALVMTSKSQQLLVLPGHEVDSSVFQQSREDEEEAHRHPDVYSLYIRDLHTHSKEMNSFFTPFNSLRINNDIYSTFLQMLTILKTTAFSLIEMSGEMSTYYESEQFQVRSSLYRTVQVVFI